MRYIAAILLASISAAHAEHSEAYKHALAVKEQHKCMREHYRNDHPRARTPAELLALCPLPEEKK